MMVEAKRIPAIHQRRDGMAGRFDGSEEMAELEGVDMLRLRQPARIALPGSGVLRIRGRDRSWRWDAGEEWRTGPWG